MASRGVHWWVEGLLKESIIKCNSYHQLFADLICKWTYLIFVIFFTRTKFLENKIYTEKTRKLRQNTQKIANFLRYYGKIHSKLTIFRVKSVKIYTGQKKFTRTCSWGSWQISGMPLWFHTGPFPNPIIFLFSRRSTLNPLMHIILR